jgi:hypothetical protein
VFLKSISSEKKAKCPVILVVKTFTDNTPVILTMPATKESADASLRL